MRPEAFSGLHGLRLTRNAGYSGPRGRTPKYVVVPPPGRTFSGGEHARYCWDMQEVYAEAENYRKFGRACAVNACACRGEGR